MSRIQFTIPDTFGFKTELEVRITDINYGNHLGHDSIMSILHETRVQLLNEKGFSEIDIGGCGLIMADTGIVFKNEVVYPARLICEATLSNVSRSSFDVFYRITRVANGALIAEAKTGMVAFDYERRRVARLPKVFVEAFNPS